MIKKLLTIIILGLIAWGIGTYTGVFKKSETIPVVDKTEQVSDEIMTDINEIKDIEETTSELLDTDETAINQTETHTTMKAILKTNKGDIEITLDDRTPKTVENFTKLAEQEFYNGVRFHRVIKGFMIQGGDPLSKDENMSDQWGTGGPGYQFDDEIHDGNSNVIGSISMANAGPNTNGSQFFINTANNGFLNSKHTVFGNVTAGMEVITAIENVETFPGDRPVEHVEILSIEIVA